MTIIQSILLGLLQGIAEFLPISSSGHLKIVQYLFDLEEVPLLFDVMLHLATLAAVCIFFRKKLCQLIVAFAGLFVRKHGLTEDQAALRNNDRSYIAAVVAATFVTGVIGVVTKKLIDDDVISIKATCAGLMVTAVILVLSGIIEKRKTNVSTDGTVSADMKAPTLIQSLVIGFAQGIGTLPGISRSGSTIAGALFCGVSRSIAGEFSFIVSIPAILGAFILEAKDLGEVASTCGIAQLVLGCAVAFASGYFALAVLMKLIKKGRLQWFAAYLVPVGIIGLFCF